MRLLATAAGLLLVAIGISPAYVAAGFIVQKIDGFLILLGVFLFIISASTIAGGVLLAALGIRRNLPEPTRQAWGRSVSALLGVALILGGWFFFMCAVRVWANHSGVRVWAGGLVTLGFLSCLMGIVAFRRRVKSDAWKIPPEAIVLPVVDENLPVVAPDADLAGLLQTKKRLKDQGRT